MNPRVMHRVSVRGIRAKVKSKHEFTLLGDPDAARELEGLLNRDMLGSDFVREVEKLKQEYKVQLKEPMPVAKLMRSYQLIILDPDKDKNGFTTLCEVWIGHKLNIPTGICHTGQQLAKVLGNSKRTCWIVAEEGNEISMNGVIYLKNNNNAAIECWKKIHRKLWPNSRFADVIPDPAFRTMWAKLMGGVSFEDAFSGLRKSAGEETRAALSIPRKKRTIQL